MIAVDLAQRYPERVRALVPLEPAILGLSAETRVWAEALKARVLSTAAAAGPAAGVENFCRLVSGDASWEAMPNSLRRMYLDNAPRSSPNWTANLPCLTAMHLRASPRRY